MSEEKSDRSVDPAAVSKSTPITNRDPAADIESTKITDGDPVAYDEGTTKINGDQADTKNAAIAGGDLAADTESTKVANGDQAVDTMSTTKANGDPAADTKSTKEANGDPAPDKKPTMQPSLMAKLVRFSGLKSKESKESTVHINEIPLGVYTLFMEVVQVTGLAELLPGFAIWEGMQGFLKDWPYIWRFIVDCVNLRPSLIRQWAIVSMLVGLLPALSLYLSAHLLGLIQIGFHSGKLNHNTFFITAACLLASKALDSYLTFIQRDTIREIKRLSTFHFGDHLMRAYLRLDLPTAEDSVNKATLKLISPSNAGDQGFRIMDEVVEIAISVLETVSQLLVLFSMIRREPGGYMFAGIAALQPLLNIMKRSSLPSGAFFVFLTNQAYSRMQTLTRLSSKSSYRVSVISDGLQNYLLNAYRSSVDGIGEQRIDNPWDQIYEQSSSLLSFFSSIAPDLPAILFALRTIRSPGTIPLKSFTLLGSTTTNIGYRIHNLIHSLRRTSGYRKTIVAIYEALEINNLLKDGTTPYPPPDAPIPGGMKIEFRDVSFKYPGKDSSVLKNMSFTLHPGQLMVIVGENGCGKSSTVKLLNRMFDATEGTMLLDDLPVGSYVAADVRRSQAIMGQDFVKYPLTIRENIGLGCVDRADDIERIHRATKLGGAFEFISEQPLGFETEIEPRSEHWSSFRGSKEDGPLRVKLKELQGELKLSGGQWQRLAISRTFMRAIDNDDVRLLCFDEPSSALDPKAEFELFERLRNLRGQKTLIFITHRFGHLTKFADLILYMKDGKITEQGTHAELLAKGEEYAHLYNVQAQAFSD